MCVSMCITSKGILSYCKLLRTISTLQSKFSTIATVIIINAVETINIIYNFIFISILFILLSIVEWQNGGRNSLLVMCWACCPVWCSIMGSILLWGEFFFLVQRIFSKELTWVLTPFPKHSFQWEYKPRSSLCTYAFHCTDSKDRDIYVLDGRMKATKTHPACTIHEDRIWLP